MYRRLAFLAAGVVLLCAVSMHGQDAVLSQIYGNGVHAYFAGKYTEAHGLFTSAIDAGTKDPRCHYFRGLAYVQLGREEEARMDFEKGAELETADVNNVYQVGRALQRIQGTQRLDLEKYRETARLQALERAKAAAQARYEAIREREADFLREQSTTPAKPGIPSVPQPPDVPAAKPFVEVPAEKPAEKPEIPEVGPAEKPVMPAEKPEEEPGEKPAEKPAENPFDTKPAAKPKVPAEEPEEKPEMPAEEPEEKPEMPAEEPEEKPAENPFDTKPEKPAAKPAEKPENPFDLPAPEKPKAEAPAEKPEMPAEEPEEPAEKPDSDPMDAKPAAAAKSGGVLGALFNAAGKAGSEAIGSAVDSASKVIPGAPGGTSTKSVAPGAKLPGLDAPDDLPAPKKPAAKIEPSNPFDN